MGFTVDAKSPAFWWLRTITGGYYINILRLSHNISFLGLCSLAMKSETESSENKVFWFSHQKVM